MTDTETQRYPDVSPDADGADALVRVLAEMDEPHRTKAVALALSVRTELAYAIEDGEVPEDTSIVEFVEMAVEQAEQSDLID